MITNVEEFVEILTRLKISPGQFLLCWLLYTKDVKSGEKYWFDNAKFRPKSSEIEDLEERSFLIRVSGTHKVDYYMENFMVTEKFAEGFLVDEDEAGKALWNLYPDWLFINNQRVAAKSCDREDLSTKYNRIIRNSLKKHRKVITILGEYKEKFLKQGDQYYAEMGIEKFVGSVGWEVMEKRLADTPGSGRDLIKWL